MIAYYAKRCLFSTARRSAVMLRIILPVTLLLLAAGCRPASYEQFIRADQAQDGEYVFALDLSDSTATYDLSFYTRVDPALMAAATPSAELALQVCWLAPQPSVGEAVPPSGVRPSDSPHHSSGAVPPKRGNPGSPASCRSLGCPRGWHVPQGERLPDSTALSCLAVPEMSEIVYLPFGAEAGSVKLYRSGVNPAPAGEWHLSVTPIAPPEGLRGIGIICKRVD